MTSRRNVNLNKELANDWVGRVRKWKRQWVPVDEKLPPGKKSCMLLKWVQTGEQQQQKLSQPRQQQQQECS
jgi:hypothetical protein